MSTKTKHITRTLTLALAAVLPLTACGGSAGEDEAAATIQVLTFASAEQWQPVIDAFTAENPEIGIEVQTVPFNDLNSVIQSRVGGGDENVDVYMVDQPRLAALASQDMLLDLSDLVTIPEGSVLQTAVEDSTYEGALHAMPVQTSTQLLFYNATALEAAGQEVPTTDPAERLTWDEAMAAGSASKDGGDVTWPMVFEQGATPYQVLPLVQSLGGDSGLGGEDMLSVDLQTEPWQEAMQWWHDAHAEELIPRGVGFGVSTETFAKGDAAFFLGGPWNISILGGQELDFEWGVTAMPYFAEGEPVTPTGSMAWGINPASDAVDASAKLLEFVGTTEAGSLAVAEGDPNLPTQVDALDTYLSGDEFADGLGELIRHELEETAVSRPVSTGYIAYETIVGQMLEDIRNGSDPAEALATAEAQLTEELEKQ